MSALGQIDVLSRYLLQRAARRAPPPLAERLEEEWLADFAARPGPTSRLRLALGCCRAASVIAHEHAVASVAAASARGPAAVTAYVPRDRSLFSRRTYVILLIIGLHAAVIYFLATGLVQRAVAKITPPIMARLLDNPHPDTPPPPPLLAGPRLSHGRVHIPMPVHAFDVPTDAPAADEVLTVPPTSLPPPPVVNRVQGGPGAGFPSTSDYYPQSAIRLKEQGVALVRACVDNNGRLTADPTLAESSGSARLDQGALRLAQAASGHYRPTTEDGRPVSSCYAFRVRFELRN